MRNIKHQRWKWFSQINLSSKDISSAKVERNSANEIFPVPSCDLLLLNQVIFCKVHQKGNNVIISQKLMQVTCKTSYFILQNWLNQDASYRKVKQYLYDKMY